MELLIRLFWQSLNWRIRDRFNLSLSCLIEIDPTETTQLQVGNLVLLNVPLVVEVGLLLHHEEVIIVAINVLDLLVEHVVVIVLQLVVVHDILGGPSLQIFHFDISII